MQYYFVQSICQSSLENIFSESVPGSIYCFFPVVLDFKFSFVIISRSCGWWTFLEQELWISQSTRLLLRWSRRNLLFLYSLKINAMCDLYLAHFYVGIAICQLSTVAIACVSLYYKFHVWLCVLSFSTSEHEHSRVCEVLVFFISILGQDDVATGCKFTGAWVNSPAANNMF